LGAIPCSRSSWPCWLCARLPAAAWHWLTGQPAVHKSHARTASIAFPTAAACALSVVGSGALHCRCHAAKSGTNVSILRFVKGCGSGMLQHLIELILHLLIQQRLAVQHRQKRVPCLVSIICKQAAGLWWVPRHVSVELTCCLYMSTPLTPYLVVGAPLSGWSAALSAPRCPHPPDRLPPPQTPVCPSIA
jgi:hypothetical protein